MHAEEDNIYFIKQELSRLRRWGSVFETHYIGNKFAVKVFAPLDEWGYRIERDFITQYEKVDVNVYDLNKNGSENYIGLDTDPRFKDYQPIKHPIDMGNGISISLDTGIEMPIINLCELIKYLRRLSKISVFY